MNFKNLFLISLFFCSWNSSINACSCGVFGFCEILKSTSTVIEARVVDIYPATNSPSHFVDVIVTKVLYGPDTLSSDTLTIPYNSNCDEPIYAQSDIGNFHVFMIDKLEHQDEANYPTFELNICQIKYLSIVGFNVIGGFITDIGLVIDTIGYTEFKSDIEGVCKKLQQSTFLSEHSTFDLSIFPNPVQDRLMIETSDVQDMRFTIYSNNGKVVKSGASIQETRFNIDVRNFSPGVYWLQILVEGQIVNRKFIKT